MRFEDKLDQHGSAIASIVALRLSHDAAVATKAESCVDALNIMLWSLATTKGEAGDKRPVSELSDLLAHARSESSVYEIHCTMSQEMVHNLVRRGHLEQPGELEDWKDPSYESTTDIIVELSSRLIREMCSGL